MSAPVAGIILAGGRSSRMGGGDKGLRLLQGRTILDRIVERARPQVAALALNANGDPQRFAALGLDVVPDSIAGFVGPLAGILAGLDWAAARAPHCAHVASFAGDAPFVPHDFVTRLQTAMDAHGADLACGASNGQTHPVLGLWRVNLRGALRRAVAEEKIYKVDRWTARYRLATVDFTSAGGDPFFNVNGPEDLAAAGELARKADLP